MNAQIANEKYREKENMMKILRGEQPDWVPVYFDACTWQVTGITYAYIAEEKKVDMFGVEWLAEEAGEMPKPDRKMLTDITKWREFVQFPDLSKIDFDEMAKNDLAYRDESKVVSYCPYGSGGQLFIPLINMMGFEDGVCALLEEPEACLELFEEVTCIFEEIMRKQIPVYKPDVIYLIDDLASATGSFISMDVFNEMFAPYYQRLINIAKEFDIPVMFHMCGKCDELIDRLVEMGVRLWEVAQPSNDLAGLKKKYGNDLVFIGGFDAQGIAAKSDVTEEYVRQNVRSTIDELAPGGGYVFWTAGTIYTGEDDIEVANWADDEARKYGKHFYQK